MKQYWGVLLIILITIVVAIGVPNFYIQADYDPDAGISTGTDVESSTVTSSIVLYGEAHGLQQYLDVELEKWGKWYAKGARDLFVEQPYYTSGFLNIWMTQEDDRILDHIYDYWDGTLAHTEANYQFYKTIKEKYPETVFHGTDVGHQFGTIGEDYIEYLEEMGLQDSNEYQITREVQEQGETYYSIEDSTEAEDYRVGKMVENFQREYGALNEKAELVMGIYGSYHTNPEDQNEMFCKLQGVYGDVISSISIERYLWNHRGYHWGFSYMGLILLLMLMIPNVVWTKNKPSGYEAYEATEHQGMLKVLAVFERIGEVLVTTFALIFTDWNPWIYKYANGGGISVEIENALLVIVIALMILYERFWIGYFRSEKSAQDFYRDQFGIPVPGATLPVAAFFILGIYGRNLLMIAAVIMLGVGHIGIHLHHRNISRVASFI